MDNKIKIGIGFIIATMLIIGGIFLWNMYNRNSCCSGPCDSNPGFIDAVESSDFENCNNVQSVDTSDYCIDYCRFQIAAYSDNSDNCEKIQDLKHKDLCYAYLSVSLADVSLCNKIKQSDGLSSSVCETLYYREYGYPPK